jgi:hypothetical protein
VLVHVGGVRKRDLWFLCVEGSSGDQGAISAQRSSKIHRPGGQQTLPR